VVGARRETRLSSVDVGKDRRLHRTYAAHLLRLVRRSRPGLLQVDRAGDTFHLALWRLGAFERDAFASIWVDHDTGAPVVRDPSTLRYWTVDMDDPLGTRLPFDHAFRCCDLDGEVLTVQ
jgi:hypothetical protein